MKSRSTKGTLHGRVAVATVTAGLVASLGVLAPVAAIADEQVAPQEALTQQEATTADEPETSDVAAATSAMSGDVDQQRAATPQDDPAATPVANYVAKIGDAYYATLDEALSAAKDGDVIELMGDASTESGFGIYGISLTIKGNGHLITANNHGIYVAKKGEAAGNLTFDGVTLNLAPLTGTPTVAGDGYKWAACVINYDCSLSFNNSKVAFASAGSSVNTGIYYHARSKVNLSATTMSVSGFSTNGICSDVNSGGTEPYSTELNVLAGSTLDVTSNKAGITAGVQVTIDSSRLTNSNNRGNGSNGADYIARNGAVVKVCGNGVHGMSARNIRISDSSSVACNGNGYYGVTFYGKMEVDGTSSLTADGNASKSGGGLRVASKTATAHVASGAIVEINENGRNGLENYGTFTFDEGAKLTVMRNHETGRGGGVYNSGTGVLTLPSDAAIYNNHADKAGDDIYSEGSFTFGSTGSGWQLDDKRGNCSHAIDGWYDDAADARWSAHGDTKHVAATAVDSYQGAIALKAAHGLARVDYQYVGTRPNGANLPAADEDLELGSAYTAKSQDPVTGWTFDGWYTDESCTTKWADGTELSGSMTLYGKWTQDPVAPLTPEATASPSATEAKPANKELPQTGDESLAAPLALLGGAVVAVGAGVALRLRNH